MKAIVQDTYGGADVLHLEDIDTPSVGIGEVLLSVQAASDVAGRPRRGPLGTVQ